MSAAEKSKKIAIYGKGGIGKSMVATTLSVCFARRGKRVLHVGCDPKADSAIRLLEPGAEVATVLQILGDNARAVTTTRTVIHQGRHGIDCCESGGPPPGVGCGGRGVARALEYLEDTRVLSNGRYDVVLFDVLGDVVCGGFAAPLRMGFGDQVYIVTSEEPMALFAANNISRAIVTYQENGISLGGLIGNMRDDAPEHRAVISAMADTLGTRVIGFVPRDQRIQEAETRGLTIVEHLPDSEAARVLKGIAEAIAAMPGGAATIPTPMDEKGFFAFMKRW